MDNIYRYYIHVCNSLINLFCYGCYLVKKFTKSFV